MVKDFFVYLKDIITLGPLYLLWTIGTFITLIIFLILLLLIFVVKLASYDLLRFTLFGLKPGDDFMASAPNHLFYRFLIVASVIWVVMFFVVLIKFSFSETAGSLKIIRSALVWSVKSFLILIAFQITIILVNEFVWKICNLLMGGEFNGVASFVGNLFSAPYPPYLTNMKLIIPSDKKMGFDVYWDIFKWSTFREKCQQIRSHHENPWTVFIIGGLVSQIGAILISIPLILGGFSAIGKVFPLFFLYLIFPIILPLSLIDDGKKAKIWKDKYVGHLISITVFLLTLHLLFSFYGIVSQFLNMVGFNFSFMKNAKKVSAEVATGAPLFQTIINSLIMIIIFGATAMKFNDINEIITAFVGTSVTSKDAVRTGKEIQQQADSFKDKKPNILLNQEGGTLKAEYVNVKKN